MFASERFIGQKCQRRYLVNLGNWGKLNLLLINDHFVLWSKCEVSCEMRSKNSWFLIYTYWIYQLASYINKLIKIKFLKIKLLNPNKSKNITLECQLLWLCSYCFVLILKIRLSNKDQLCVTDAALHVLLTASVCRPLFYKRSYFAIVRSWTIYFL